MLEIFRIWWIVWCSASAMSVLAAPASAPQRALPTEAREWKGDFDGMLERRHIRVLVPYSRTLFYNDKGRERGITAECARAFQQYLNKKYAVQLGKRQAARTDSARCVRRRRRAGYAARPGSAQSSSRWAPRSRSLRQRCWS